jgi:quercetin dioxygenase-like cupin family protein
VKIVRAADVEAWSGEAPATAGQLAMNWLEGPFTADRLDVGLVTLSPGGTTPPHVHIGGQVMIVTAGRGFVEVDGERQTMDVGDVVICPPGEQHVHGALADGPLAHLTITTGGYRFPDDTVPSP